MSVWTRQLLSTLRRARGAGQAAPPPGPAGGLVARSGGGRDPPPAARHLPFEAHRLGFDSDHSPETPEAGGPQPRRSTGSWASRSGRAIASSPCVGCRRRHPYRPYAPSPGRRMGRASAPRPLLQPWARSAASWELHRSRHPGWQRRGQPTVHQPPGDRASSRTRRARVEMVAASRSCGSRRSRPHSCSSRRSRYLTVFTCTESARAQAATSPFASR